MPAVVLTLGHSTRPIDEFVRLLTAHQVALLVDVRTIPRSRRNPQFERQALARSLQHAGIDYLHMPELGGLRRPRQDSINTAWKNASFRGYADYMQTPEFADAIGRLLQLAEHRTIAVMCAESVPWRCHRSLIADAVIARQRDVHEIVSERATRPHKLTAWARVEGTRVTYPGVV